MSAGPVSHQTTNIPGANQHTANILKESPPVVRVPPRTNIDSSSSTYRPPSERKEEVKSEVKTEVKTEEAAKVESTKEARKAERQKEWSALSQANKLKKEAEDLKRQSDSFSKVKDAPEKLNVLAKSLGMSPDELLNQLTKERLAIPTNKVLTPAEQQAAEAKSYKEQLDATAKKLEEIQFYTVKSSHINRAILPELIKSPDDFEFCHKYGVDKCASEVYDYCNESFQNGNPLNEVEVLKEFEQALYEEWAANVEAGKGLKKTSKYFQAPAENPAEALGATTENLKAGKQLAKQLIDSGATDPDAKRIAKSNKSGVPAGTDMNKLVDNNKLSGGSNVSKINYDRNARKAALKAGL